MISCGWRRLLVLSAFIGCSAIGGTPAVFAQPPITVTLQDGSINPAQLAATKGSRVSLNVVNAGSRTHNLVVPAFFLFSPNLKPGESVTMSFSPDKVGTFPYYSDTGGKPEPGMQGQLTIR